MDKFALKRAVNLYYERDTFLDLRFALEEKFERITINTGEHHIYLKRDIAEKFACDMVKFIKERVACIDREIESL